mmetsp:Transcript_26591/g.57157  ORF Transcript_26591/g.57157 Transcript_26591/m.57157 type:complete len:263 (+) Transcript_26591:929-1717(+)
MYFGTRFNSKPNTLRRRRDASLNAADPMRSLLLFALALVPASLMIFRRSMGSFSNARKRIIREMADRFFSWAWRSIRSIAFRSPGRSGGTLWEASGSSCENMVRVPTLVSPSSSSSSSLEEHYQDLLSYRVLPTLVCRLLSLSLCYTGPGVPPERSQTTKSYLFSSHNDNDNNNDKQKNSSKKSSGGDKETGGGANTMTVFGLGGRIHGDLQKGFVRAEVIKADELLRFDSFREAKEAGSVRTEGKDYAIEPNDTVLIKWRQ